jgi:transcriptional regulator with XRE-family HTH domain
LAIVAHITSTNDGSFRAPHGTIGNAIRHLRTKQGLTQEQLAKKCEVTQSAVASWESGRTCPKTRKASMLAYIFNVPLEFILGHRKKLFPTAPRGTVHVNITRG